MPECPWPCRAQLCTRPFSAWPFRVCMGGVIWLGLLTMWGMDNSVGLLCALWVPARG